MRNEIASAAIGKSEKWIFLSIVFFTFTTYWFSHFQPFGAYHITVVGIVMVGAIFFPELFGSAFIVLVIVSDDFPRLYSQTLIDASGFKSIYNISFLGQTLYLWVAIWFLLIFIFRALYEKNIGIRKKESGIIRFVPYDVKIITLVLLFSALLGVVNIPGSFRVYISDAGYFLNIIIGFAIVRRVVVFSDKSWFLFRVIIYALLAKVITVVIDGLFLSSGLSLMTIKPGSDAYLVGVVILFFLTARNRNILTASRSWVILGSVLALVLMYSVITASRGRTVVLFLALALFFLISRRLKLLLGAVIVMLAAPLLISAIPHDYISYFLWKVNTFDPSSVGGESSLVRLISFQNIVSQQVDNIYQFFVGTGLGGYFSASYHPFPMNLYGGAAFPDEWIRNDTYYQPHGSFMFLLLKTGWGGLFMIYGSLIVSNIKRGVVVQGMGVSAARRVACCSIPMVVPLIVINFSSKLQILTGVFIAFSYYATNLPNRFVDRV